MLDKKYNHIEVEKDKYNKWKEKGYFKADPKSTKTHYSMVIPPPNVTGKLHIGHAYDTAIQDANIKECKDLMFYGYLEWIMLLSQLKLK